MEVPYFMDGERQMKKVKDEKKSEKERMNMRIDEVKEYMKNNNMRYIKPADVANILSVSIVTAYSHLKLSKEFEKIQKGVFEWVASPAPKNDYEATLNLDEKIAKTKSKKPIFREVIPDPNTPTERYPPEQHKTPESMPMEKDTENPEPMITEESIKSVREKNKAEDKLKHREAQNEEYEPKEIIKVVILRCPHCGGALKNEERG